MDKIGSCIEYVRTQLILNSEATELFIKDKPNKSVDLEVFGAHPVHLLFHNCGWKSRKKNKKISDSKRSNNVEFGEIPNQLPFYGISQDASKVQAFKDEVKTNIDHVLEFRLPISWIVTIPITNSPDLMNEAIKHEMNLFFEVLFDIIREYQITQSYEFPPAKELPKLSPITSEVNEFARAIFPELKFHFVQLEAFHEVQKIIEHLNNRGDYFHERSIMLENESGQLLTEGAWTRDDEFRFQLEKGLFWMRNSLPILILGESGVGKTKVAQWLQKVYSSKSEKMDKFLHLNCAVTMTDILRSELFGYEEGAFTGAKKRKIGLIEEAKDGVIFLDEIGKASIQLQKELYMFIEQKKYRRVGGSEELTSDAKLIFAANEDLEKGIREERILEDFYYRIYTQSITIPPLRDRRSDIPLITYSILRELNEEFNKNAESEITINSEALEYFQQLVLPGNIRELRKRLTDCFYFCRRKDQYEINIRITNLIKEKERTSYYSGDFTNLESILEKYLRNWDPKNGNIIDDFLMPILAYLYEEKLKYKPPEATKYVGMDRTRGQKSKLVKSLKVYPEVKQKFS